MWDGGKHLTLVSEQYKVKFYSKYELSITNASYIIGLQVIYDANREYHTLFFVTNYNFKNML